MFTFLHWLEIASRDGEEKKKGIIYKRRTRGKKERNVWPGKKRRRERKKCTKKVCIIPLKDKTWKESTDSLNLQKLIPFI